MVIPAWLVPVLMCSAVILLAAGLWCTTRPGSGPAVRVLGFLAGVLAVVALVLDLFVTT